MATTRPLPVKDCYELDQCVALRGLLRHERGGGHTSSRSVTNAFPGLDMQFAIAFIGDESGGTAAEYALILALIASAIVTSLAVVGGAVSGSLSHSTTTMFH